MQALMPTFVKMEVELGFRPQEVKILAGHLLPG